jgi:hypothetical protein
MKHAALYNSTASSLRALAAGGRAMNQLKGGSTRRVALCTPKTVIASSKLRAIHSYSVSHFRQLPEERVNEYVLPALRQGGHGGGPERK